MEPLTATRLQVCITQPTSTPPGPRLLSCEGGFILETAGGPQFPRLEKGNLMGTIMPASQGFEGQQRGRADERTQPGA